MNSLDIFSVPALTPALEQIHSAMDLAALLERLPFTAFKSWIAWGSAVSNLSTARQLATDSLRNIMIDQLIASPTVKAAMEQFITSAAKLLEQPSPEDRHYEAIRAQARTLLDEYRKDPLNIDLAVECDRLVQELENLDLKEMTESNADRSRANIVFISAQTKRTHYAAYMAGCVSSNQHVGDAFKAWMHNAAADGAISLYEAIRAVTQRHRSESQESELLRVFGNGAFLDARRFLTRAAEYYPECVLTHYNEAKILMLAGATTEDRGKIGAGINQLKGIHPPANDCHSAELVWHGNIYETYAQGETHLRKIIGSFKEDEVPRLDQVFQTNANIAKKILAALLKSS